MISIDVGDTFRTKAFMGAFRVWKVVGVYYGGENQESVIEMVTLDRLDSDKTIMVPVEILWAAKLERV